MDRANLRTLLVCDYLTIGGHLLLLGILPLYSINYSQPTTIKWVLHFLTLSFWLLLIAVNFHQFYLSKELEAFLQTPEFQNHPKFQGKLKKWMACNKCLICWSTFWWIFFATPNYLIRYDDDLVMVSVVSATAFVCARAFFLLEMSTFTMSFPQETQAQRTGP